MRGLFQAISFCAVPGAALSADCTIGLAASKSKLSKSVRSDPLDSCKALVGEALRGTQIFNSTSNVRVIERFGPASSALLRELDESHRFVQKSAESTSI
mgnify:CR=1 FL=1